MITRVWDVQGTGPVSLMDNMSYSHRLVMPIMWDDRIVSFQTRDITDKHFLRYITCPESREIIKHKHIFYQAIPTKDSDTCICVEGVTDAWRFGDCAIATFGIKYTRQQVRAISKRYKRVFVVFDDDPQGNRSIRKIDRGTDSKGRGRLFDTDRRRPRKHVAKGCRLFTQGAYWHLTV